MVHEDVQWHRENSFGVAEVLASPTELCEREPGAKLTSHRRRLRMIPECAIDEQVETCIRMRPKRSTRKECQADVI